MSSEAVSVEWAARQTALRLAFGVTTCFALVEALDWDATFLAPLLATNILAKLQRPPSLTQGIAFAVLIALSTGIALVLTNMLLGSPATLILAIALLVYVSFYAHRRGAPELVTLLLQVSAVSIPVIAVLSPASAGTFAAILVMAGIVALAAVWTAFAAFPNPASAPTVAPTMSDPVTPPLAASQALTDTLILLPILTWFILDATEVAVVVLIVIVTVLRQHDSMRGQRAALGLVVGNVIGGMAAAMVHDLVLLGHSFPFFVVVLFAASLIFAGRIVTAGDRAAVFAIALATFVLLLGLGLSPLPGGSDEAFMSRLLNVLFASAYAVAGLALLGRWRDGLGASRAS